MATIHFFFVAIVWGWLAFRLVLAMARADARSYRRERRHSERVLQNAPWLYVVGARIAPPTPPAMWAVLFIALWAVGLLCFDLAGIL